MNKFEIDFLSDIENQHLMAEISFWGNDFVLSTKNNPFPAGCFCDRTGNDFFNSYLKTL